MSSFIRCIYALTIYYEPNDPHARGSHCVRVRHRVPHGQNAEVANCHCV